MREIRPLQLSHLKQVLIIDDDPVQLRVRETVLRGAGFEVSIATSAESGMALLRTGSAAGTIGLVITDHVLPRATGADFARMLRREHPSLPIIVLSGAYEAESEYSGLEDVTYRQKPLQPRELIELVRKKLEGVGGLPSA